MIESRSIAVHGVTATVFCSDRQILEWFEFDFRHFVTAPPSKADFTLTVKLKTPPFETIPAMEEVMHARYFACFEDGKKRYINYQNKALLIYDYGEESGIIYCDDQNQAYEKTYLTLLSRIGEKFDDQGLHRVHALGITYKSEGCLFLLPEGGGKSTLGLSLLKLPDVKLFSEDTPFINREGIIYPFPFRLGIREGGDVESIPPSFKREVITQYSVRKTLVDTSYFVGQVETQETPNRFLFCGKWITNQAPRIAKISKLRAFGYLIRDCIFGLGLPQVIELFLTSGPANLSKKAGIALSRTVASLSLLKRSQCYQLFLSNRPEENAKVVASFLEGQKITGSVTKSQGSIASG